MPKQSDIRKPIDALRPRDIESYAVWEFLDEGGLTEGEDETWVQPLLTGSVPRNRYALSVAVRFQGQSGQQLRGIVSVTTAGSIEIGHGAILMDDTYLFLPAADFRGASEQYRHIEKTLNQSGKLFPLHYELQLPLEGESSCRIGKFAI